MKKVCAWCNTEMVVNTSESNSDGIITHVMCDDCAEHLLWPFRPTMEDFIDKLDAPVLVVNSVGNVNCANKYAREILQKELPDIVGHPGGVVFECAFARLPEGCGNTLHCDGCTIRNTVIDTFQSGLSHLKIPAGLTRGTSEVNYEIQFLISTEKVKDVVLLRIDSVGGNEEYYLAG